MEKGTGICYCSKVCQEKAPVFTMDLDKTIEGLRQKRHILYTSDTIQLSIQRLLRNERVEPEIHQTQSQFIRVEEGHLEVTLWYDQTMVRRHLMKGREDVIIIEPGIRHLLENKEEEPVAFYTIYAPPAHTRKEQASDDKEALLML
jgi:mannose-6-phosphate isomerase-like protein (cupin superfamily)